MKMENFMIAGGAVGKEYIVERSMQISLKTIVLRITIILILALQSVGFGQTFSGQVFEVAEYFNTEKCQVFAECDCCTSDIFFLTTDKFWFVSRCISGDSYFTGTYSTGSGKLKLTFDKKYIVETTDDNQNTTKFQTKIRNSDPIEFDIANCGQKIRLTHATSRELKNGVRYETKSESELIKKSANSKAFKLLSE